MLYYYATSLRYNKKNFFLKFKMVFPLQFSIVVTDKTSVTWLVQLACITWVYKYLTLNYLVRVSIS